MQYNPPWNTQFNRPVDDPDAPYINANPSAGIEGSVPPAESIEYPQREIIAAAQLAGFTPTNDDLEQLTRGIRQGTAYAGATVIGGGDPNALYVNLSPPLDEYRAGLVLRLKIPVTNTGPAAINVDNLGMRNIVRSTGAVLTAGDLVAGMVVEIVDDGEKFQIVNFGVALGGAGGTTETFVVNIPYCVDLGSANHIIAPFSPPIASLTPGLFVLVKIAANCTGATDISVNGLPAVALVRTDLRALAPRDIIAGMVCAMVYDGTRFQMVSMPASIARDLIAPLDYYVNGTTGLNTNDGLTPGTAFQTITYALQQMNTWNNRGYQFTIHVADGTYQPFTCFPINGSGTCFIVGNVSNPQNCHIYDNVGSASNTAAIAVSGQGYKIAGFKIQSVNGHGLVCLAGGGVSIYNVEFAACGVAHMSCAGANISKYSAGIAGAFIRVSGSSGYHELTDALGTITMAADVSPKIQLIISAPITIGVWTQAAGGSYVNDAYSSITGKANVGGGTKFSVQQNAVISTGTGDINYLPGANPGVEASGGRYT